MIVEFIRKPVKPSCYPDGLWSGFVKEYKGNWYYRQIYFADGHYKYGNSIGISEDVKESIEKYQDECEKYTEQTGEEIFKQFAILRQSRGKYKQKLRLLSDFSDNAPPCSPILFESRDKAEECIEEYFAGMTKQQRSHHNKMIVIGIQ